MLIIIHNSIAFYLLKMYSIGKLTCGHISLRQFFTYLSRKAEGIWPCEALATHMVNSAI